MTYYSLQNTKLHKPHTEMQSETMNQIQYRSNSITKISKIQKRSSSIKQALDLERDVEAGKGGTIEMTETAKNDPDIDILTKVAALETDLCSEEATRAYFFLRKMAFWKGFMIHLFFESDGWKLWRTTYFILCTIYSIIWSSIVVGFAPDNYLAFIGWGIQVAAEIMFLLIAYTKLREGGREKNMIPQMIISHLFQIGLVGGTAVTMALVPPYLLKVGLALLELALIQCIWCIIRWGTHFMMLYTTLATTIYVTLLLNVNPNPPQGALLANILFNLIGLCLVGVISAIPQESSLIQIVMASKISKLLRKKVKRQFQRTEDLLNSAFPKAIVTRMKKKPGLIAHQFDECTSVFMDIANFTQMSSQYPPETILKVINGVFHRLDSIMIENGLEKITTVGDAYLAVAGIPKPFEKSPLAACKAAFQINKCLVEFNKENAGKGFPELSARVGVSTGYAMAGLVGLKKFNYDAWGTAIEQSQLLESNGVIGKVLVNQSTFDAVMAQCSEAENPFVFEAVSIEGEAKEVLEKAGIVQSYCLKAKNE